LAPGSAGISTVDVLAVQRHFLNISLIPAGCRLTAADVNGDNSITTVDVIAIQRFFLGFSTGTANVGKYSFNPASRSYPGVSGNQTNQNYDTLIFGDVAASFVYRPNYLLQNVAKDGEAELPASVASVSLPELHVHQSANNLTLPVATTPINEESRLVGFQGDFTFDERVVTFANEPVQKAGLTHGNWNVSGNILSGTGPMRTLRISAYSTDFRPLSGEGTLFELRVKRVNKESQGTLLDWAAPPNQFIFIDVDLNVQPPSQTAAGRVVSR
jgi:hypothetical protein